MEQVALGALHLAAVRKQNQVLGGALSVLASYGTPICRG